MMLVSISRLSLISMLNASDGIMPTVRTLITQCTTGSEKALAKPEFGNASLVTT